MNLKAKLALLCFVLVLLNIAVVSASDVNLTDEATLSGDVSANDSLELDNSDDSEELVLSGDDINASDSLQTSISVDSSVEPVSISPDKAVIGATSTKKKTGISPEKYTIASGSYYKVSVYGSDRKPLANVPITMRVWGVDHNVVTNSLGVAKLKIDLGYGKYPIVVSFAGNENYEAVSKTFNFFVGKTTFVVIGNDRLYNDGYLRIYLKSDEFWPVAKRTLKISIGTINFKKVTNSEGFVVFKPGIGKGFRDIHVTFDGDYNVVGSEKTKRVACLYGSAKNPLYFKIPMKNGAPDIDYLVGNYVMGDENSKYTILKAQYLEVIKRDSKGLCLYKKLTNYVFTKTKSEPNYNHIFQRTKWNVFERDLNTRLVLKNSHNYWPYEITASLKGKAYTYSEVRDVQNTGYTCGPTSSSMCTQVLRCYLNEQFLASKSGTNYYDGSSTVGLKKGLELFNMKCTIYYKSSFGTALNELKKGGCALIFHTWNHYVAILDISKDGSKVLVGNPSGDYDHGSHDIPTNWLTVDHMYSCFNDYDTSGLIVKLKYSMSKTSISQMSKLYQNMGSFTRQNTNERIPNTE